jgi:hypothetical protein
MIKKVIRYFKLLLFFDMNATTYGEIDIDELIKGKARGNLQLQQGQYMTQEEYDLEREKFLNHDYTKAISKLEAQQDKLKRSKSIHKN